VNTSVQIVYAYKVKKGSWFNLLFYFLIH